MNSSALIYGSYGYSGKLISEWAVARGLRPILAGRDGERLREQATALDLEHRVFSLDETSTLEAALSEVDVVAHCAGPFQYTFQPMLMACLRTGTHYLDINGELPVLESIALQDQTALAQGVMLLPGAGFDVVASDCLVAHLKRRSPSATHLRLAIQSIGSRPSRGTSLTGIEFFDGPGAIRVDGELLSEPIGTRRLQVDFGKGPLDVFSVPWADLCTAYHSTGIGNIETYHTFAASMQILLTVSRYLGWLMGARPVKSLMRRAIIAGPPGPTPEMLARGRSHLWAQVSNPGGEMTTSRLHTPTGYRLTALATVAALEKILDGDVHPGFQTPATAYGADFILEFEDVQREDL